MSLNRKSMEFLEAAERELHNFRGLNSLRAQTIANGVQFTTKDGVKVTLDPQSIEAEMLDSLNNFVYLVLCIHDATWPGGNPPHTAYSRKKFGQLGDTDGSGLFGALLPPGKPLNWMAIWSPAINAVIGYTTDPEDVPAQERNRFLYIPLPFELYQHLVVTDDDAQATQEFIAWADQNLSNWRQS